MMLTPADIDLKQFSTTRLKEGYVQDEVDDFLDRVQEDYKFLTAQVKRLEAENATLKRITRPSEAPTAQLAATPPAPTALVEKMLAAAETAAQQHEAEAKARADDIVREAGGSAARIVEEAVEAADKVKAEGLAEKYRRNEELDRQHNELASKVGDLRSSGQQIKQALSRALSDVGEL